MALTEKDFEELENEALCYYGDNPLPRMMFLLPALKNKDNIHFGKNIARAFIDATDFGYIGKEHFEEYDYQIKNVSHYEYQLDFEDGSSLIFNEGTQSFKLLNSN